jgi:two-component system chemotaxis response regulator CheB
VDVLFRSASRVYGPRVIAVVLTGALDDGSAGVFAVKQRGGMVVVQDPNSARFSSMPENALRATEVDYCVPLAEIAALLVKLVRKDTAMPKSKKTRVRAKLPRQSSPRSAAAPFVCPDCSGPLFQVKEGPTGQLACLVGHAFSPESLSEAHREALERALLTSMRLLQERAGLHKHLASARHAGQNGYRRERFRECAEEAVKDAALLREILERI